MQSHSEIERGDRAIYTEINKFSISTHLTFENILVSQEKC